MLCSRGVRVGFRGAAADVSEWPGAGSEYLHSIGMDAEGRALFLGTHFGLFRSENAGATWKPVPVVTGHPHLDVMSITPHPRDPLTIYLGTHSAGVFRTADGGAMWVEVNRGFASLDVHGVAVDPDDPAVVYAAVLGVGRGIYRTVDGEAQWGCVFEGPTGQVMALALVRLPSEMEGKRLYVGTTKELFRRPDRRAGRWSPVSSLSTYGGVNALAVTAADPSVMYLVARNEVLKSTDHGSNWSSVARADQNLAAIAMNPRRPAEVYVISDQGAILETTDGGVTWQRLQGGAIRAEMRR